MIDRSPGCRRTRRLPAILALGAALALGASLATTPAAAGPGGPRVLLGGSPPAGSPWALLRPAPDSNGRVVVTRGRVSADGALTPAPPVSTPADLLLALRAGDGLLVTPFARGRVDVAGRWVELHVTDAARGTPVPGARARCRRPDGLPAPLGLRFREGVTEAPEVLGTGRDREEFLPEEPGMIAFGRDDGTIRAFLPSSCASLVVSGPGGRYREQVLAADALPSAGPTTVRLRRSGGITLRLVLPSTSGEQPRVEIATWPAPLGKESRPSHTMSHYETDIRVPLPEEGEWFVVARVPGFAPALVGPVTADEAWPVHEVRPARGVTVTWIGADPAGGGSFRDGSGREWWPLLGPRKTGDGVAVGPVPPGTWTYDLGARCRGSIRLGPGATGPVIRCAGSRGTNR